MASNLLYFGQFTSTYLQNGAGPFDWVELFSVLADADIPTMISDPST